MAVVPLCSGTPMGHKLVVRRGSYVNRYSIIEVFHGLEIGENCMIGPYYYLTDDDHAHLAGRLIHDQPLR